MSSVKSVLVRGTFLQRPLSYRLCPNTEFSVGAWNLCIHTIAYVCVDPNIKTHCSISCNFVRGQQFSSNGDTVLTYQMPLQLFTLESGSRTVSGGAKI